ncbi:MAG: Asp23/Gls24 family envelope stress response protein [Ruminococcus sp.]|nr:Asp23/Gls24 family envelope stress response protein [Ruminococcus sp.]
MKECCKVINIENHIGKIVVSENYLRELVENTVTNCFGVADVCNVSTLSSAIAAITGKCLDKSKGVDIYLDKKDNLIIDLHITVAYGTNINAVSKSISHKVRFAVEESIGVPVHQVNVFIDDMNC